MSRTIVTAVLMCFVAISLATNVSFNYVSQSSLTETSPSNASVMAHSALDGENKGSEDGKCLCKENTGTLNLVCGVTLAVTNESPWFQVIIPSGKQLIVQDANSHLDIVWKFKRPPREVTVIDGLIA